MKSDSPIKQLTNKIKSVNNILITVSRNPGVDQLASTLGLSLALNKLGKRSVAVFSGKIPPAIHFLNPEKTFEDNADSLRDFIISLSKDKADRLKVRPDGEFVKVYITPYRTKITPADLKFEEGDFNIELIIAIGVSSRDELDASIASHGKIFHNAVTATLNLGQLHDALGMISWQDTRSGCYAQMCYQLINNLSDNEHQLVDEAVATALLTGVVSATDQFRNKITTPEIMTLSANLMAKGANQQLITSELESAEDNTVPGNAGPMDNTDSRYDPVGFDRNIPDDKPLDNGPTEANIHKLDDEATERLAEDQKDLSRQQGVESLHATQAKLLEKNGTIDITPTGSATPAEAPRIDDQSTDNQPGMGQSQTRPEVAPAQPAPAAIPPAPTNSVDAAALAPLPPLPSTSNVAEPASSPATSPRGSMANSPVTPIPTPATNPLPNLASPLPTPGNTVVTPLEPEASHYVADPLSQINGLAGVEEGATAPTDSGSYLIGNQSAQTIQPPVMQDNNLPFNQPNQVSPLANLPMPGQAPSSTNANAMPDMTMPLPPLPPSPNMPSSPTELPPAVNTPATNQSVGQPIVSMPASASMPAANPVATSPSQPLPTQAAQPAEAPRDPSQFVIPS